MKAAPVVSAKTPWARSQVGPERTHHSGTVWTVGALSKRTGVLSLGLAPLENRLSQLPDHSQFVRQEQICAQCIEQVACLLAEQRLEQEEEPYQILDATGVPVRHIKRRGGGWLAGIADKGWCSRISSYMGFHVLLAITPQGFLTGFGFAPASVHDTRLAETFLGLRAIPSERLSSVGKQAQTPYMADRAYASEGLQLHWLHDYHARQELYANMV